MAVIHDYLCVRCHNIHQDCYGVPAGCECGCTDFEITFRYWKTMHALPGGTARDARTDAKGGIKNFTAGDDGLCLHELGLEQGSGIKSFSPDQSAHYLGKMLTDGDSANLRKEILDERKKNLKADGSLP